MLNIALIVPPISNLNTPYSAVPRLAGWLRSLGHRVQPIDLSLELVLRVFSRSGLERVFAAVDPTKLTGELEDVWTQRDRYPLIIEDLISFLQGRNLSVAHRIIRGDYVPEGPHFRIEGERARHARFGEWGKGDHARQLVSYALEDLTQLFHDTVSPHFDMLKYGEGLCDNASSFDALAAELEGPRNVFEEMMLEAAEATIPQDVDLVAITCPFAGMMMGSLVIGKWLREHRPRAFRALGGGFPSTELRSLTDARIFDYVDTISIDDGEIPLRQICARLEGQIDAPLYRTYARENDRLTWHDGTGCDSPKFRDLPAPDYTGFDMSRYIHLILTGSNPMARLSNEGPWLKLTAAHGCYWKKCTFCDIHLPYISDFDPLTGVGLADQMDAMHEQTGLSGFHFTDEAAPPALLVRLAIELLRRGRTYSFWGNIRFDTAFTPDRCKLLAAAGMIAVTGGIEIASDDLLPKIRKGITVPQVIRVLSAFSSAKILTHAYLIYGFPGERDQDTINSLEILRQLMRADVLHSGYFHRFGVTSQSPIGRNPELFGIRVKDHEHGGFADYFRKHESLPGTPTPDPRVHKAIQTALIQLANGKKLDEDVRSWFLREMPAPTISPTLVEDTLRNARENEKDAVRLCWLGGVPRWTRGMLTVTCADGEIYAAPAPRSVADKLSSCHPSHWRDSPPNFTTFEDSSWMTPLRRRGLVTV